MSEQTKFEINQHIPIELGGLKMFTVLTLAFGWMVGFAYWLQSLPKLDGDNLLLLEVSIVGGCLILLLFGVRKAWNFTCAYWRRNVRGEVANCMLKDGKVMVFIRSEPLSYGFPLHTLVWVVPLGGWRKKRQRLLMYHGPGYIGSGWEYPGWNFHLISSPAWALHGDPSGAGIRLKDQCGNALSTYLLDGFRYVASNPDGSLRAMFPDYEQLQESEQRLRAIEKEIRILICSLEIDHNRFAKSGLGVVILDKLRGFLLPDHQPD